MKPTSDERREVARRIRNNLDEQASWVVPWAVFNDADNHGGRETMERLADLIDPTCEVEGSKPLYMDDETEFQLSCGHAVLMTTNEPPAYCTECGARVIS